MPPSQPDPSGGAPPGLAGLLGGGGMPPPISPSPIDANAAVMRQFMELDMQVDAIARQFPQAAEAAREVKDSLKEMLVAIVSAQPSVDGAPAPRAI
jgi:hypothetical protein